MAAILSDPTPTPRACTCRTLPPELLPVHAATWLARQPIRAALPPGHPASAALVTASHWDVGAEITFALSGGTLADYRAFRAAVAEWERYAGVTFLERRSGDAMIRCLFNGGGASWSYLGTQALAIPRSEPTMVFGWRNDPARDLHELGHVLGLVHEHQNPQAQIPWNVPAVMRFYGAPPNNWPPQQVQEQVLAPLDPATLTNGGYDR